MKRLLAAALAACTLAVVALPAAATAGGSNRNIVQVAAGAPQFSTLVKLVKEAGLVSVLSGRTKFTVFAPTNAAFALLPASTLTALSKDRSLLKAVLLYHVVPGALLAKDVVKHRTLTTAETGKVSVSVRGGNVYINTAEVIKANILASNGVIHEINAVLIPPKA
jgi:uncharacterized surface protein with fasciclin (FAS1) repeats